MKIKPLYIFVTLVLILSACSVSKKYQESGTLKDYTKLAGCSYVIELDNGDKLEPLNLKEFDDNPKDGKRLKLKYEVDSTMASNCSVGKIVKIVKYEVLE
jgi:hypothetical protein